MLEFLQGFPVRFDDFLGTWIPCSPLKSRPVKKTQAKRGTNIQDYLQSAWPLVSNLLLGYEF